VGVRDPLAVDVAKLISPKRGSAGVVFLTHGSVDVALGWPLRYSHSSGEVIDTKDLDALGKIVEVLARKG
jgi:putative aminopeptidase FrvX